MTDQERVGEIRSYLESAKGKGTVLSKFERMAARLDAEAIEHPELREQMLKRVRQADCDARYVDSGLTDDDILFT